MTRAGRGRPTAASGTPLATARVPLPDRVAPDLRVLFVGINPGLRSAAVGHHFAGPSNRFWKLLYDSGLVDERVGCRDDSRLPRWGYGLTNLVSRPTAGLSDLKPQELRFGRRALSAKVRRLQPSIVALVGVTLYRALFPGGPASVPGPVAERLAGARVFVLPNPSGRNANFSYLEMLGAWRRLRALVGPP